MKFYLAFILAIFCYLATSQSQYTSYYIGDTNNVSTPTDYRICLMGGATEDDNAMKWFLNGSGGGDIVVIRVSGTSGYNAYLYTTLGITVNSVETIVIPSISAANHPYVRRRLREAEAVFIAGGNQFDYLSYWKNTAVDSALNYLINIKKVPIGGTSAGMAVQGQCYYSAAVGSITSAVAMANPYNTQVTIGSNDFLHHKFLNRVITDTHYDNPDRRGRHSSFLARLLQDSAKAFFGIACDEYTAVCIDNNGIAKVFGGFPTHDDNAYFIQSNCVLPNTPENCLPNQSLTWNRSSQALKVYAVKGTSAGNGSFDLNNWQNANVSGGAWENWFVVNGTFSVTPTASSISCISTGLEDHTIKEINMYPNPVKDILNFGHLMDEVTVMGMYGKVEESRTNCDKININQLIPGMYLIKLRFENSIIVKHFIKE